MKNINSPKKVAKDPCQKTMNIAMCKVGYKMVVTACVKACHSQMWNCLYTVPCKNSIHVSNVDCLN